MGTMTLKNLRTNADVKMNTGLKDGGVSIDWATLTDIKAWLWSDAQKAIAGRCDVRVDAEDSTKLICEYAKTKAQYPGVNRLIVQSTYMGATKTYDKPAFNFVRWTAEEAGTQITLDDPEVDVDIDVQDVTSSILQEAIAAALAAAADAEHAAHLIPNQVLLDCEAATQMALTAAARAPLIGENGNWWVWNSELNAYVDTGKVARGATGNGIASWNVVESQEDDADNVITITFTDGSSETFTVKNGNTGNGIASVVQTTTSLDDAGTNVVTVTMTDGTVVTFRVKNGSKGQPGAAQAAYKSVAELPTASAATMDKIYLTPSETENVYNMSYTDYDGTSYSWVDLGTTEIQLSDYATNARVDQLDDDLNGKTQSKKLPVSNWMDSSFTTAWGSNTDVIYIDDRNVIDAKHKIKKFQIYRLASGTIRVYFLKKLDMSIVTYKEVTLESGNGVKTFDMTLEDEYYANGEMYVGINSSITWGSITGPSGTYPNTYTLSISNGTLTLVSQRAWGYGITIDEITDGELDKMDGRLAAIEDELADVFPKGLMLPSLDWLSGHFTVNGGGSADYVFYDSRCVVQSGFNLKTIRVKATGAGSATIYRLSSSNQVLASQDVTLNAGVNSITPSFSVEEGDKIGICSASSILGMRAVATGEQKYTYSYRISNGAVAQSSYYLGMDITLESVGELNELKNDVQRIDDSVETLNDIVFENKTLPSSEWIGGAFTVNGGGSADYAYLDTRTLIPAGVVPERVRMKATASNNITVYLLKASDYSVLASETKAVVNGINDITPSFDEALFSVPTYIAVASADSPIAMRDTNVTGETSYTTRVTIATGASYNGLRYIVSIEVKYTAVRRSSISEDLAEAIAQGGNDIVLGPYDYAVTTPIELTSGMTIRGSFGKTRLILTDGCQTAIIASNANDIKISDLEIVGTCPDYSYEMNGIVAGVGYDLVETEENALALDYMGTEKGIYLYYCENVILENLKINHITGSAVRVNHTGMNYIRGLNAVNIFITNCYNGIYCENEHEFSQYTNWAVTLCMIGIYVASGNLIFTAGHATRCRVGLMFVSGTNHAHGIVNGVEMKHNQIAGLLCSGVQYGEFFQGCYISYAKLIIRDCTGLYFDDLVTGNMHIDATGSSGKNMISKLVRRSSGVVIDNQERLQIGETINLY